MEEYFSFRNFPFNFLFKNWVVSSAVTCFFTCLSIGCIAFLFEGIRVLRVRVQKHFKAYPLIPVISDDLTPPGSDSPIINSIRVTDSEMHVRNSRIKNHVSQTLLHVLRLFVSYFLMLAVMTYNAYVAISIVGGACLGYFIFCHDLLKWRPIDVCTEVKDEINFNCPTEPNDEAHPMLETSCKGSPINENNSEIKA